MSGPIQFVCDVYAEELKTYYPLHHCPVDVDGGMLPPSQHSDIGIPLVQMGDRAVCSAMAIALSVDLLGR